jgi:hypothetical protein
MDEPGFRAVQYPHEDGADDQEEPGYTCNDSMRGAQVVAFILVSLWQASVNVGGACQSNLTPFGQYSVIKKRCRGSDSLVVARAKSRRMVGDMIMSDSSEAAEFELRAT